MKAKVLPYLTFNGNCEEAFNFYKSVFRTEFSYLGRFKDIPSHEGMPAIPEEYANQIMHVALPVSGEFELFGSDSGGEWAPNHVVGNNISLYLNLPSVQDADKIFAALSEGGTVSMPMGEVFWGAYFGMFTDKFGINWMISVELHSENKLHG